MADGLSDGRWLVFSQPKMRREFRLLVVVFVGAILIWFSHAHYEALKAGLERAVFQNSVQSLKNFIYLQKVINDRDGSFNCHQLKERLNAQQSLQPQEGFMPRHSQHGGGNAPQWKYHPKVNELSYRVSSKRFFSSKNGQLIELKLNCNKGELILMTSPHKWCLEPFWWGCRKW